MIKPPKLTDKNSVLPSKERDIDRYLNVVPLCLFVSLFFHKKKKPSISAEYLIINVYIVTESVTSTSEDLLGK